MAKFKRTKSIQRVGMVVALISLTLVMGASGSQAVTGIRFATEEATPEQVECFTWIAKEFEKKNPDIRAVPEYVAVEDYQTKLAMYIRAGLEPEIAHMDSVTMTQFRQQDLLLPLGDVIDSIGRDDYIQSPLDVMTRDGKIYGAPIEISGPLYFYRTDLLEQAGLAVPKTTEEVLEVVEKLTMDKDGDGEIDVYGISMGPSHIPSIYISLGELYRRGGKLCTPDDKIAFGTIYREAMVGMVEYLEKLSKFAPPGYLGYGYYEQGTAYMQGKAATTYYYPRLITNMSTRDPKYIDVTAATLPPPPPGGEKVFTHEVAGWSIFKNSKHPEAAKKFLEFALTGERYVKFLLTIPVHLVPVRQSVLESSHYLSNPLVQKFQNVLKMQLEAEKHGWRGKVYETEYPGQYNPMIARWMGGDALTEPITKHLAGRISAEEAVDEMVERCKDISGWEIAD